MASLKETKGRINSVKSTLKITSAMKMVASAKLHKAQNAIESMLPYEQKLRQMLQGLLATVTDADGRLTTANGSDGKVALVVFSSNSSLCGGFNANVIRDSRLRLKELAAEGEEVVVFSVGKKIAEAMRKSGFESPEDLSELLAHQSYASAAAFAQRLVDGFLSGEYKRVELIYTHFVSTSTQRVTRSVYLPMDTASMQGTEAVLVNDDVILEPSAEELLSSLLPRVLALSIYTVILDTTAAEHAARTVAMQTATDNGESILQELTLEYNKGRQQKITSEILDLVGGSQQ